MYRFKDVPQIAKQFSELEHLLKKYDFNMLEERMKKIKMARHREKAIAISEELAEILKIAKNYQERNEHDNMLDLIVRTIRLRKKFFDARCEKIITMTKFQ